jgi:hypothetical protein
MTTQPLPTVRVFAPELWGEVDYFVNLHDGTYKFAPVDARAVEGVRNHFQKARTLQSLAIKLRSGLEIDQNELETKGYTSAVNSTELSAIVEAAVLELYSSVDCTVKVLHAVYGASSRSFAKSTRGFFQNLEKISGSFPEELKLVARGADWYEGLRFWRDELTHLATGRCSLDRKAGTVSYMHFGMKRSGEVFVIEDVFKWLADTTNKLNMFLGPVFRILNTTLNATPVQQTCGFVEGRLLLRYLDPTERPLTFDSGQCFAYRWFDLPENPRCPFADSCGAYRRKMP